MTRLRCAIYTRKSTKEGLDQSFNSLDAQREACEAYIASQKGEGWSTIRTAYDDGGWSGGTMDRPGLAHLLADIAVGKVDVIVVYKVDRLTRSLADFAKMVELFDRHSVSFVSVTQAFNTTSSMGRLTLNVLLSFAQFEREVTGERIRDKIAASKARGMWMGGTPALGYEPRDRTLVVIQPEAELVRAIFGRFLELGSVNALVRALAAEGVVTKRWTAASGRTRGGVSFSRGALFHLLRNRLYLGEIVHKGKSHPGQHPAIIDSALFDAVQARLASNAVTRGARTIRRAPLVGLLFDADGNRMSPTHSRNRHGRHYLYYVSAPLLTGGSVQGDMLSRVSAAPLEEALLERLRRWSGRREALLADLLSFVKRIQLHREWIMIDIETPPLEDWTVRVEAPDSCAVVDSILQFRSPLELRTRGGKTWLVDAGAGVRKPRPDRALIAGLRRAHAELDRHGIDMMDARASIDEAKGIADPYLRKLSALAFLAPDIQNMILEGRQPPGLTLASLLSAPPPLDWHEQRRLFGSDSSRA